jgi:hypothetical protein
MNSATRAHDLSLSPSTIDIEEATMTKVSRFVTDPKVGAYCRITLDSGEKIVVNHDRGDVKAGRLTVEVVRLMGLTSQQVFACDLASPQGAAALERLTIAARGDDATPLGALVKHIADCRSVADVTTRCAALLSG